MVFDLGVTASKLDVHLLFWHWRAAPQPHSAASLAAGVGKPPDHLARYGSGFRTRGVDMWGSAALFCLLTEAVPTSLSTLEFMSRQGADLGSQLPDWMWCCPPMMLGKRGKDKICSTLGAVGAMFTLKPRCCQFNRTVCKCSSPGGLLFEWHRVGSCSFPKSPSWMLRTVWGRTGAVRPQQSYWPEGWEFKTGRVAMWSRPLMLGCCWVCIPSLWPWASPLTPLGLNFLIHKLEMTIIIPDS